MYYDDAIINDDWILNQHLL